jgi:8-oxo-dGTP pyrophosphatase MutT (NUDIX family)
MRFDYLLARIQALLDQPLPGSEAHDAILPALAQQRKLALDKDKNPKLSSVAATFFPKEGETHILLIQRQSYDGVHSGQISFPGGKVEERDQNLVETALREMEEEVGVLRNNPKLIRSISQVYIPPSRFLVHPFLFYLEELPKLKKNEREVDNIIFLPLSKLLDDALIVQGKIKLDNGVNLKTPYFEFQGHKIWGATAMMLSEIKWMLKAIQ